MNPRWLGLFVSLAVCAGGAAVAHHSSAMFDRTRTVDLAGTVKQYQFSNPHVWIEMIVPAKGGHEAQWSIEGEAPMIMARMGLGPTRLKVGDKITVRAHPLRDGRPGGSFIAITLANGSTITSTQLRPK
jgi:hypothetical protein